MTKHQPESERRAQILRSARSVFLKRGFHAARVDDVARSAKLSKGAVYFYFSSKQELLHALVIEEHEATYDFLEEAERDEGDALGRLVRLGWTYLTHFLGARDAPMLFLMMTELGVRDDDIREECLAIHQRFTDALTRILAQGIAEGALRPCDPAAVAGLLKAMIDGYTGQAALGIPAPDAEALLQAFTTLLRGLLQEPDQAEVLVGALT